MGETKGLGKPSRVTAEWQASNPGSITLGSPREPRLVPALAEQAGSVLATPTLPVESGFLFQEHMSCFPGLVFSLVAIFLSYVSNSLAFSHIRDG